MKQQEATQNIIHMRGLLKDFTSGEISQRVLQGIDLDIKEGDYLAIMGASGSGKSTLLYVMGLLHQPSGGDFTIWGKNLNEVSRLEAANMRNRHIGFVFQESLLLPELSVRDNVELPLYYAEIPARQRKEKAMALLDELGLAGLHKQPAKALSGGEKQRVAIARALINEPRLILADEPTGSLDKKNGENIMKIFDLLHEKNITVVMVTHDQEIADHCHSTIHIQDGRVV